MRVGNTRAPGSLCAHKRCFVWYSDTSAILMRRRGRTCVTSSSRPSPARSCKPRGTAHRSELWSFTSLIAPRSIEKRNEKTRPTSRRSFVSCSAGPLQGGKAHSLGQQRQFEATNAETSSYSSGRSDLLPKRQHRHCSNSTAVDPGLTFSLWPFWKSLRAFDECRP